MNDDSRLTTERRRIHYVVGSVISGIPPAVLNSLIATPFDVVRLRMQLQNNASEKSTNIKNSVFLKRSLCRLPNKIIYNNNKIYYPKTIFRTLNSIKCNTFQYRKSLRPLNHANIACVPSYIHLAANAFNGPRTQSINGVANVFKSIIKIEGVAGLWRGFIPTFVSTIPSTCMYLPLYSHIMPIFESKLSTKSDKLSVYAPIFAGVTARIITVTISSPLEFFRTRIQSGIIQSNIKSTIIDVKNSFLLSGYLGPWRGLSATLLRDLPFSAIYWFFYELTKPKFKTIFSRYTHGSPPSKNFDALSCFISGASSGSLAAAITTPFDVAKTYIQVSSHSPNKPNLFTALKNIFKNEGITGIFRGLSPRVIKITPVCAVTIGSYEFTKMLLIS